MSKKLLFQLDTDAIGNSFDTVVAYDGGADHVIVHGGINPQNVGFLVDGCIFTRGDKQNTAIFVGGSNLAAGQELFNAVQKKFFAKFRVSVMLDSNGSNTTAAAGVACLTKHTSAKGKRAVILAGTGPVGQRAAAMLAGEGAQVVITSRTVDKAQAACDDIKARFGYDCIAAAGGTPEERLAAIQGAHLIFSAGAASSELLREDDWATSPTLEVLCDANATPPLGIAGIGMGDKAVEKHGKIVYGALGFGNLKLAVHRACVGKLFEAADQVFDAEQIYAVAKGMV